MSSRAVIGRELAVHARSALMPWWRALAGGASALGLVITLPWLDGAGGGAAPGQMVLSMLSWLAFVLCAVVGVTQTADSLSHERREGTLGLLFLTRLRGVDVVLGKLAGSSLPSLYCLLATFPAMAIALPAGGVTAGEFWRTQLALLDTLFLAVACGLLASARNTDHSRAVWEGFGLFLAWLAAPLVAFVSPELPVPSPAGCLVLAGDSFHLKDGSRYWKSLLLVNAVAWVNLFLAGRRLRRSVGEEGETAGPARSADGSGAQDRYRPSPSLHHAAPRSQRPGDDPAGWLAGREHGLGWFIGTGLLLPAVGAWAARLPVQVGGTATWTGVIHALHLLLPFVGAVLLASGVAAFLGKARRSGALELLLCTPLPAPTLVAAAWARIRKYLGAAFIASAAIWVVGFAATNGLLRVLDNFWIVAVLAGSEVLRLYQALVLCRLALWFSVSTRRPGAGIAWPIAMGVVAPLLASYIVGAVWGLFIPRVYNAMPPFWFWLPWLVPNVLTFVYLAHLDRWARGQLAMNLREAVAGSPGASWPFRRRTVGAHERT